MPETSSANPLRWFPELYESSRKRVRPQAKLLGLSLVVGVVAGLGAVLFFVACQFVFHYVMGVASGYHPVHPGGEAPMFAEGTNPLVPWMLVVMPTVGGLLSGVLVYTLAPEAEGHGTDAAIAAYHYRQGQIRTRVPLVKLVASAITLGFGGSGGREGPIAQIGAGCGSFLGTALRLRAADRRVLMAAGMGAGIAAVFRAPLAGALFAAEVLYRSPDFESEVIIPACLASVVAYSTFGLVFGWEPLFVLSPATLEALKFDNPLQLISYTVLVLWMVALAAVYVRSFYALTDLFRKVPLPHHVRPAIGGALTGLLALALYYALGDQRALAVLSFGYGVLQEALVMPAQSDHSTEMALLLLAVAVGKIVTTGLTIGSGGSGGVFGPSMVIGGCAGGALGICLHNLLPQWVPHPASFVVVGMAGFFAAAAKTPFSTLVMVSELTGNYSLLLPTLWVCSLAFIFSDEKSIYSSQIEKRSLSPAHQGDYVREVLGDLSVRQFIGSGEVPALRPSDTLQSVIGQMIGGAFQALPVVDGHKRLLGVVSLEEVHLASQSPHVLNLVLASDLMRDSVLPLGPDDRLDRALELFVDSGLSALPVCDGTVERHLLGLVKRSDVARLYLRYVQGSTDRQDRPSHLD